MNKEVYESYGAPPPQHIEEEEEDEMYVAPQQQPQGESVSPMSCSMLCKVISLQGAFHL